MPSLTLGPHWPTGIPGVRPDDDAASKELVHGMATVNAGQSFSGPVPLPPGTAFRRLADPERASASNAGAAGRPGPAGDRSASLIPIPRTRQSRGPDRNSGTVAASNGQRLRADENLSFWMRGTGQIQNMFAYEPLDADEEASRAICVDVWVRLFAALIRH
ncbi:MAG: hypothetical protein U1F35_18680 [Steroidobacteraceae bacterium]